MTANDLKTATVAEIQSVRNERKIDVMAKKKPTEEGGGVNEAAHKPNHKNGLICATVALFRQRLPKYKPNHRT